jgi:hypothetical protein
MAHALTDKQRAEIRSFVSIPGNTFADAALEFHLCAESIRRSVGKMKLPDCPCKRPFGHSGTCSFRNQFGPKMRVDVIVDGKCCEKACPFPSFKENLCRTHFYDTEAQSSLLQPVTNLMQHWMVN